MRFRHRLPTEEEWTLIVNKQVGQFDHNAVRQDFGRAKMNLQTLRIAGSDVHDQTNGRE